MASSSVWGWHEIRAPRMLLAHGMRYELPDLDGISDVWAKRVFHCRIRFLVRRADMRRTNCFWLKPSRWRRRESNPRPQPHEESVYKLSPGFSFALGLPPDGPPLGLAPL